MVMLVMADILIIWRVCFDHRYHKNNYMSDLDVLDDAVLIFSEYSVVVTDNRK